MTYEASIRTPVAAAGLFTLVLSCLLLPVGAFIADAMADAEAMSVTTVTPDTASDMVGATAAEFRVDESGAATYSIPLYGVPGTAGVVPKLALSYSSQGANGPLGKGWSISGLSSIARCRATREAGDFIVNGIPTDGVAQPVNFTSTDRFCLDGQRLVPAQAGNAACPAVSGMVVGNLRTEIESFQRVCAYTPSGGTNGPAFFTIERKDGSISWYGDRNSNASANRPDAYFNSTAAGKTAFALSWAQTRFQDSTGNYIDYLYWNIQPNADTREHLLKEVMYTGKTVLPGQTGSALAPYARIVFNYTVRPTTEWSYGYQAGGRIVQSRRLDSVTSLSAATQARYYKLSYAPSLSGSKVDTLSTVTECRDSTQAVCLPATTFTWSDAKNELATSQSWEAGGFGSTLKFEGFKLGDIDGDGRPDMVWLKDGASGESCPTEHIMVSFGEIDSNGRQSFSPGVFTGCTPTELMTGLGEGSWQLFDYTGDGRDDLFVGGGGSWLLYPSQGRTAQPLNTGSNLLASIYIPRTATKDGGTHPQLTDLNGDGLMDVIYQATGWRVRFMERNGATFVWGAERQVTFVAEAPEPCPPEAIDGCMTSPPILWNPDLFRLADFNGDAASDLLFTVSQSWKEYCEDEWCPKPVVHVSAPRRYSYGVSAISATTVEFKRQSQQIFGDISWSAKPQLGDVNADGLTDLIYQSGNSWRYALNTGTGFLPSVEIGTLPNNDLVKAVDLNGDGRTDLAIVKNDTDSTVRWFARYAQPAGGFSADTYIPGNQAFGCGGTLCDARMYAHLFADLDGDGGLDYFTVRMQSNQGNFYLSQAGLASRGKPRDVITRITNGLGAKTELTYAPLTSTAVYRRDANSRDGLNWGRGAPVLDFLAPMYVVAKASSSSPQASDANAMASLHYRYAGARVQAGGRGFLGFREIVTFDPNQSDGHVATSTVYRQDFPFAGMPAQTIKRAFPGLAYLAPSCLALMPHNNCYGRPGEVFPDVGGSWFLDSSHVWEADSEIAGAAVTGFAPGVQAPIHVRTAGTDEKLRDPIGGTQTSRVLTTFDYGSYGNVSATTVDTHQGLAATPMATVITANTYADNATLWRLGRLTGSTITHRRPSRADVVRSTSFAYSMTGPVTGQLTAERTQANGSADQDLRKEYTYDAYGNRTVVETCAAPATSCTTAIAFHPATLTAIQRYSRTTYDSQGRYPVTTYEPFWNGVGAIERATQTVLSRNVFGDVTEAVNVNGVSSVAVPGTFGRPYYTWSQTLAGGTPGDPVDGVESWTRYRWCGTGSGQVSCPTGAKFRQETAGEGSPTGWTYLDALGRPIMKAAATSNAGVSNTDVSAVCTSYDGTGKAERVSNPFFLAGIAGANGPIGLTDVCTSTARKWAVTTYDVLGRPIEIVAPDNTVVSNDYVGLQTVIADPRGNVTTQTRNAKGELTLVTDANGLATSYWYQADGSMYLVSRDAGRGVVQNSFVYDALGRKVRQGDPDNGISNYEYNALGELTAQIDAAGNRIEHDIDARGRVWRSTAKKYNGPTAPQYTTESQSLFDFDTAPYGLGQLAAESITGTYTGWAGQAGTALGFTRSNSYDALGRPASSTTSIDGVSYPAAVQYDALGRPWKSQDASGRWAKTEFGSRGHAMAVCNSSATDVVTLCPNSIDTYLRTLGTDPWGHTLRERRGNSAAMDVTRSYNAASGRIATLCGGNTACNLVNEAYAWDEAGNLSTHQKDIRYLEVFTYDSLNRLTLAKLAVQNGVTVNTVTQAFHYDALGNICRKTGLNGTNDYTYIGRAGCGLGDGKNSAYGSGGTGTLGPHQVGAVGAASLYYDSRGNQTIKDAPSATFDRTIQYSVDDKAHEAITGTGVRTRFWYGSDGARYKREDGSKRTLYLGNVEIVTDGGVVTTKRTVAGVMLQTVVGSTATNQYLFHDHLGSVVRITNSAGAVINSLDYAAFGERRDYATPTAAGTPPSLTTRGFTGHEHVDGLLGIIHMNGRIFDPALSRFLQTDPMIQAPDNAQSWNAYTYVFNNPLAYTDPTGMMSENVRQYLATAIAIVAACFGQFYASAWITVSGAFVAGAVSTKSLQGGVLAAFGAGISLGIGLGGYSAGQQLAMHAVSGGIMELMQGGNFGNGFAAAGLTAAVMPQVGHVQNDVVRTVTGAIVGGSISEATGGKFANGAVSGAIQGAMAKRPATDEVHNDGVNEPRFDTVSDLVRRNPDLAQNVYVNEDGSMRMSVPYDVAQGTSASFEQNFVDTVETSLTGTFTNTNTGSRVRLTVDLYRGDNPAFTLAECSPVVCSKPNIMGGWTGGSKKWLEFRPTAPAQTRVHEFMHFAGLMHQWNITNSLMSYSPNRSLQGTDVHRLYDAYSK